MKVTSEKLEEIEKSARSISSMMGSKWTLVENMSIQGNQEYGFRGKEYKRAFSYGVPYGDSPTQIKSWEEGLGKYLETVDPQTVLDLVSDLSLALRDKQKAESEAAHWKANHECEVSRARVLKERPDMPLERVNAYNRMVELEEENKALKQRIASLEDVNQTRMMLQMIQGMVIDNQNMNREQLRYWQTHFRNPNGW
ncbi:hypothetical protein ECF2_0240 [Enterobacter phage EC-F2]|uniref:Uncharacterized protein n=2 Tax=root TaxID=1 RepID=A0A7T3NB92_9CAUD|nr:hypothetical protein [Cronobacter phage vB_CsaM_SemperBestia]URP85642.1 hypothetical protein ECW1_0248 [Enterobacter phage EC-W1]URP86466.1 hypothetical protein ECF2_0240 [Enterobacter phage EC-F2]